MVESEKNSKTRKATEALANAQISIGNAIQTCLNVNHQTMQDFAKKTGINASRLTAYRRGDPTRDPAPSLENLIRIKNGLGISFDQLLGVNMSTDLNGNLTEALDSSLTYTDNGKAQPLNLVQRATIKRLVYAYLNIKEEPDPDQYKSYIDKVVAKMIKERDGGDDRG